MGSQTELCSHPFLDSSRDAREHWASLGIPGGNPGRNRCDDGYRPQILRRTSTSLFVGFGTTPSSCDLNLWFTTHSSGKHRACISGFRDSIGLAPVTLHPLPDSAANWYGRVKEEHDESPCNRPAWKLDMKPR